MKKRIISLALSAVTAISAVSAMSANALWYWGVVDEEVVEETFGDYDELEGYDWLGIHNTKFMYLTPEKNDTTFFYEVYRDKDRIYITVDAANDVDKIKEKIQAVDEELYIHSYVLSKLENKYRFDVSADLISPETAKKICEIVEDVDSETSYNYNQYRYQNIICEYLTGYQPKERVYKDGTNEIITIDQEEKLREYADSHNEDFELVMYQSGKEDFRGFCVTFDMIYLKPKKELTRTEHLELAKEIYEATGCQPLRYSLESATPALGGVTLDLTDYLNGDANRDKTTSIADAAAIMQAIGNPDKYSLSDMGEFNADYDNNGLTVDDAVAIQKKLAKVK